MTFITKLIVVFFGFDAFDNFTYCIREDSEKSFNIKVEGYRVELAYQFASDSEVIKGSNWIYTVVSQ